MQPAYAILINELVKEYHAKRANLRAATATPPELQQQLDNDYAYRLSIDLEDALEYAYSAGDIESARQIDGISGGIMQVRVSRRSRTKANVDKTIFAQGETRMINTINIIKIINNEVVQIDTETQGQSNKAMSALNVVHRTGPRLLSVKSKD